MDRETAWEILTEYTKSESLRKHARTVEAVMRYFARLHGEDEEKWGIAGMLHDFDYEIHPTLEEHPQNGSPILEERGVPEDIRKAILGHAPHTGVPRDTLMAQVLFAVDELAGFVTAVALVRPSKSVRDVKPKSVKKKLKDKSFAAKVNRDEVRQGMEELGVDPTEHMQHVIDAMCEVADEIGLAGTA
ncbi:MAG: HD domain-containing protein [Planctomycetota bacterium]|jgi:putative nucleotidyltransferase with HDIG domain